MSSMKNTLYALLPTLLTTRFRLGLRPLCKQKGGKVQTGALHFLANSARRRLPASVKIRYGAEDGQTKQCSSHLYWCWCGCGCECLSLD